MYFRIVTVCFFLALANGYFISGKDKRNHVYRNQEKDLLKRILKVLQERQTTDVTGIVDTLAPTLDIPLTEVTEAQRQDLKDFTKTAVNTVLTDLQATDYTDCVIAVHTTVFLKRHVKPLLNRMQNTVLSAVTSEVLTEVEDIKILKDVRKLVPKFMKEVSESVKAEAKEIKDQIDTIIGAEVELEISEGPRPTPVAGTDSSPKTTKDLLTHFLTNTVAVVEQLKTLIPTDASTKCPQVVDAIVTAIENRSPPDVATIIIGLTASEAEKKILQNLKETLNTFEKIKVFENIKAELEGSTGLEKLDFVIEQHMTNLQSTSRALNLLETLTSGTPLKELDRMQLSQLVDKMLQRREAEETKPGSDCMTVKYMGIVKGLFTLDRFRMNADNPDLKDAVKSVLETIKNADKTAILGDNTITEKSVGAVVLALSWYYKEELKTLPDIDKSAEILPFNLVYTRLPNSKNEILPEEETSESSESSESGEKPDKVKLALKLAATMEQGLRVTTDLCPTATVEATRTTLLTAINGLKTVDANKITDLTVKIIENLCTAADVSCPDATGIKATDLYKDLITPVDTLLTALATTFDIQETPREIVVNNLGEIFFAILHPEERKNLGLLGEPKRRYLVAGYGKSVLALKGEHENPEPKHKYLVAGYGKSVLALKGDPQNPEPKRKYLVAGYGRSVLALND